jgi:hypothetical protein
MPDKLKLYVITRYVSMLGVHYLPVGRDERWETDIMKAHFFTKKSLAYERLDTISPKDTLMKVKAVEMAVN